MLVMDRENLYARGWSHVLSTTSDVGELEAFRLRVGAPAAALHVSNRGVPHLDLKLEARDAALASVDVVVFERTAEMLRYLRDLRYLTGLRDPASRPSRAPAPGPAPAPQRCGR